MSLGMSIAGLGSVLERWTIALLLLIAVLVVTYIGGCAHGMHQAALEQQAEQLQAERQQLQAEQAERQRRSGVNAGLSLQAAADKAADAATYLTLRAEVPHVVLVSAPAVPGGACGFAPDFVRLWNDALFARSADAAGGAAGAAATPGTPSAGPEP